MRKLIFDYVSIEITRQCNLKCRHCLRGDAQDIDIDLRTIDALVEQTAKIYNLSFTGGEPTLNVPAMAYTLEALRGHKVPLHSVEVATNGMVLSSEFVKAVKEFSRYIAETGMYASYDGPQKGVRLCPAKGGAVPRGGICWHSTAGRSSWCVGYWPAADGDCGRNEPGGC